VFVVWAGLWLGPIGGLFVGAIGPTIADAIGFPQFMLATAVTKGLEGFLVGLIAYRSTSIARRTVASICGASLIVIGYFVFEAYVYPWLGRKVPLFAVTDLGAAVIEILPNTIQAVVGAAVGLSLWRATSGFSVEKPPGHRDKDKSG
jgi:uncharacterized membrane protein